MLAAITKCPAMEHSLFVMRSCVTSYLRYIKTMDDEIREIESRIRDMRARLVSVGASLEGSRSLGYGDRIGEGVARIMELEEKWSERVSECYAEIAAAQDMCDPHHVGRWAMWMHVVEGRTWAYIGRVIGYSEAHTRQDIADEGVREIYRLMPEAFRRDEFPNAAPL